MPRLRLPRQPSTQVGLGKESTLRNFPNRKNQPQRGNRECIDAGKAGGRIKDAIA